MNIREWIAENIAYRLCGCYYNKFYASEFESIRELIPKEFLRRKISDLACGDGSNTLRVKDIFKAKSIVGYEHNKYLIRRAREKGVKIIEKDLNQGLPKGEMAVFTYALHHLDNKEKVLKKITDNFDYLFLIEPTLDLNHFLFDAGKPLKRNEWIELFDKTLKNYTFHRIQNEVMVLWKKSDLSRVRPHL